MGPNHEPTAGSRGLGAVSVETTLSLFVWWIKGA